MKRQWDIEDLIEHFTLVEDDLKILANKTLTRLGCALLLKCFQLKGTFPTPNMRFRALLWTMWPTN